ncbi:hypothetical protein OKW41_004041 [Paraburkholderia sp. UCT70]
MAAPQSKPVIGKARHLRLRKRAGHSAGHAAPTGSINSMAPGYQGPGRNWTSPYQACVVAPVLSVSVSSPVIRPGGS